jgi:hypothetical protein
MEFDSVDLYIQYTISYLTVSMLEDISTSAHDYQRVLIGCPSFVWNNPEQCQGKLSTLLQTLFLRFRSLQRVEIIFDWEREQDDINELVECASRALTPCRSGSLHSFKIEFIGEELDTARYSDYFRSLDACISPTMVLNRYRNSGPKVVRGGVLPLAVRAVNMGIPYRNTMDNVPCDMASANAGLIFLLVQNEDRSNDTPSRFGETC